MRQFLHEPDSPCRIIIAGLDGIINQLDMYYSNQR